MTLASKYLPNYNYKDYCSWEGQWEIIIEGIPYAMSPMANPRHQRISVNLTVLFENELGKKSANAKSINPLI